jgi:ABC-2 type transport system ATP-binding protein
MNGISIKNVTMHYGKVPALQDVSIHFEENKIYGLLGRNGAGKSTLLKLIANRIFADSGEITIDGEAVINNDKVLGKVYFQSEKTYYPDSMKIKAAFQWSKCFYPDFDEHYAQKLADSFELNTNKSIHALSTGYTSILKLIIALSVNAPYLLLDEPVLGLDAYHRDLFYRSLLEKYNERPCTIIISTHLIEEVSNLVENLVILKKGKIITEEACETLLSKGYTISGCASAVDAYIIGKNIIGCDTLGGLKTVYIMGTPEAFVPAGLEISKLDLQRLFIQLTNS